MNDRKHGEEKMCIGEEQKEVWGVLKLISEESTDGEVPTERTRTES